VLVLCLNQGRTSDSHCGKQALFNATPNSVSVLSEIASGRRLGEWLQRISGCGGSNEDTAAIFRGTRAEPWFGRRISSCNQETR